LARLDGELGKAFQNRKAQLSPADTSAFVADQLAWIRDRNTRCDLVSKNDAAIEVLATSKPCLASAVQQRIASFVQTESTSAAVPPAQQEPMALIPPSTSQPPTKAGDDQGLANPAHHAAHSETDVFMRAVGFALTGSDDADVKAIDRANCVFAYKNKDKNDVVRLNNVHVDRIKIQSWTSTNPYNPPRYVTVQLHGDDVVFEETTEPTKDDGSEFSRMMREAAPQAFQSHHNTYKEHELMLETDDQDRVTRAWQYIYSHGCIGKKSPF
jgi:hypothetical protein